MVFDHIDWGEGVHTYIQSFHMPLFFIVSGYLFKERGFIDTVKIKAKKLMLPYYVFLFVYLPIKYIFHLLWEEAFDLVAIFKAMFLFPTDNINMPIGTSLWFLPCMFIASVAYSFLSRYSNKTRIISIAAISIFGAVYSAYDLPMLPFALEPACVALLFMEIGHQAKKINYKNQNIILFTVLGLAVHCTLAFLNIGSVDMRSARYHIFPLFVICACVGTAAYYLLVSSVKNEKIINVLSWFGRNSMSFLCTNKFFIIVTNALFYKIIKPDINRIPWMLCNIPIFIIALSLCVLFDVIATKTKLKKLIGLQ